MTLSFQASVRMSDLILFPGASAATILGKGFLAVRKAGHLCVATERQRYSDYTGREKTMEVRVDVLKPGQSIHIISLLFIIFIMLHIFGQPKCKLLEV